MLLRPGFAVVGPGVVEQLRAIRAAEQHQLAARLVVGDAGHRARRRRRTGARGNNIGTENVRTHDQDDNQSDRKHRSHASKHPGVALRFEASGVMHGCPYRLGSQARRHWSVRELTFERSRDPVPRRITQDSSSAKLNRSLTTARCTRDLAAWGEILKTRPISFIGRSRLKNKKRAARSVTDSLASSRSRSRLDSMFSAIELGRSGNEAILISDHHLARRTLLQ